MHARHEAKFTVSHFKNTLAGLRSEEERWGERARRPSGWNVAAREKRKKSCDARSLYGRRWGKDSRGKKRRKGKNDEDARETRNHRRNGRERGLRRSNNGGGNRKEGVGVAGEEKVGVVKGERRETRGLYNETRLGGHRLFGGTETADTGIRP